MAAATDMEKINVYAPVSTDDHELTPKFDGLVITKPTPDSPQPLDSSSTSKEKKKKDEKRRGAYFFCCSNLEFDTADEDDKAKALVFFQNTNKNRMYVEVMFYDMGIW
ncbi:hypothetical protein QYF36_004444 [Acer negundo]|nr:hypothetical protein QYF36_004444 [Acer negundo]